MSHYIIKYIVKDHKKSEKKKQNTSVSVNNNNNNKKPLHNVIEKSLDLGLKYFTQVPTLLFINCDNLYKEFNLSKLQFLSTMWGMVDHT